MLKWEGRNCDTNAYHDLVDSWGAVSSCSRPRRRTKIWLRFASRPRCGALSTENERLDMMVVDLPTKDFAWNSQFQSAVKVDAKAKLWRCEMSIPVSRLADTQPVAGTRWRLNLFRCDRANHAGLAWRPTLSGTVHTSERFGVLEFVE